MFKLPSTILRYGVILGLAITLVGILSEQLAGLEALVTFGLMIIVVTPLASLMTIGVTLARRRDLYGFALSQLAIAVIVASILISLQR